MVKDDSKQRELYALMNQHVTVDQRSPHRRSDGTVSGDTTTPRGEGILKHMEEDHRGITGVVLDTGHGLEHIDFTQGERPSNQSPGDRYKVYSKDSQRPPVEIHGDREY